MQIGRKLLVIASLGFFFAGAGFFALSVRTDSARAAGNESMLGSVDIVGFNFAPRGWMTCNGQLLPISKYTALYSLLGTQYGGDGRTTFGLPDLRGRIPVHAGKGIGLTPRKIGQKAGSETSTLTVDQLPAHSHAAKAAIESSATIRVNGMGGSADAWSEDDRAEAERPIYGVIYGPSPEALNPTTAPIQLSVGAAVTVGETGGGKPVDNMPPFLVMNYVIAVQGIYPSRN